MSTSQEEAEATIAESEGEAKPIEAKPIEAKPEEESESTSEPAVKDAEPEEEEVEEEEPEDGVPRVLVTGASGYIALAVTKALLQDGRFRIRGTVRNKKKKEKIQPLLDLVPDAKYPLRLIEADLEKPESWAKAIKSCSYVFHLASPFPTKMGRQPPEEEIIRPAVDGTLSVLKACAEAGTVKRVILTSSIAAVSCGMGGSANKPGNYVYTEADWSDEDGYPVYERSKFLAEKAAWDYVKSLEEDKRFELVVVNPAFVQGPLLSASSGAASMDVCKGLFTGKMSVTVDISFPLVDVRDVAAAQIAALEKPEAAGNRYILFAGNITMKEITRIMNDEFKRQGYTKIPSINIPKFVAWMAKHFDPSAKSAYPLIGKSVQFNNEKMVRELGIQPHSLKDTIIDTCYSLIEKGLVEKTPGYLGHPSTRPPPPAKDDAPAAETAKPEPQTAPPADDGTGMDPEQQKQESSEVPATEEPKDSVPATEEPKDSVPATEEPKDLVPATEEPVPATDEPKNSEPATEEPKDSVPATEELVPATDEPKNSEPATDEPKNSEPATDEPKDSVPATEESDAAKEQTE